MKQTPDKIYKWRNDQILSVQAAFKAHEKQKAKEFIKKMKKAIEKKEGMPKREYTASPEQLSICVLKLVFDTMNCRKNAYFEYKNE